MNIQQFSWRKKISPCHVVNRLRRVQWDLRNALTSCRHPSTHIHSTTTIRSLHNVIDNKITPAEETLFSRCRQSIDGILNSTHGHAVWRKKPPTWYRYMLGIDIIPPTPDNWMYKKSLKTKETPKWHTMSCHVHSPSVSLLQKFNTGDDIIDRIWAASHAAARA